ncbi:MAG: MFS transporter [Candidatus Anstonellales archaeon]
MKKNHKQAKHTLYAFSYASMLNDFSSDMLASILPFIIKIIGGNERDITIIMGIRKGLSDLLAPLINYYTRSIRSTKMTIMAGYTISAFGRLLLLLSTIFFKSIFIVYISIIVDRMAKALRDPIRDSIIGAIAGKHKSLFFSIQRSFDTVGAFFGSLFAAIFSFLGGITLLFISALTGFLSVLPLINVNDYKKANHKNIKLTLNKAHIVSFIPFLQLNIGLPIAFFAKSFLESIIFYVIFNLFFIFFSPFSGKFGDKNIKIALFSSVFFSFLSFISFYFSQPYIGFLFMGLSYAMFEGNARAYITKNNKESFNLSLFYFFSGVFAILSSLIAAYVISIIGVINVFLLWALLHAFAIFIFKFI